MASLPETVYSTYLRTATSTPDSNGDWRWITEFTLLSQSTSGNYSRVRAKHYIDFKNQPGGASNRYWIAYTTIGSSTIFHGNLGQYAPPEGDSTKLWYTYDFNVYHNANGTKTVALQGSGGYTPYILDTSVASITLPTIPRYATITTFSPIATSPSAISVQWATNVNCSAVYYSLDNQETWSVSVGSGTSGSFNLVEKIPNTTYPVTLKVTRTDSGLDTISSTINVTTMDKARITNANVNLDVDTGINITFTNPSNLDVHAYVETYIPSTVSRTVRTYIGSPYNLVFTSDQKNALFEYSPNSNTFPIRVGVMTIDGALTHYDWKDGTATISSANPTFTTFTYADTNATTLALTGDPLSVIKGYSNVRATITSVNKAVAIKGANMTRSGVAGYRFQVGSMPPSALTSYSADSTVNIDVNNANDDTLTVTATDSRANSTPVIITVPANKYFEYFTPIISTATIQRENDIGSTTTLTFEGSFFNADFGDVTNDVTLTYRYREVGSETWGDWSSPLTVTKASNTFSFSDEIAGDLGATGFDIEKAFQLQIKVEDELASYTYGDTTQFLLGSAEPSLAKYKNSVAMGGLVDETIADASKSIQFATDNIYVKKSTSLIKLLDVFYPVGTIYETTSTDLDTTTKMGNYFGGTWEAYGSGRVLVGISADTEFDAIGETGGAKTVTLERANIPEQQGWWRQVNGTGTEYVAGLSDSYEGTANASVTRNASVTAHNNLQPYIVVYRYRRTA